ncbi:hypothetical protein JTE90_026680 [Oedothorax gibbosus]|uniref:Uncharacterized protein n=1 Tax=Oedothorax gibbosus TaxID=931172 RepID=A0AAV6V010_9ARAC|nr:hypothetical protein JTE90_026680 [Oedothorax gibbosus]
MHSDLPKSNPQHTTSGAHQSRGGAKGAQSKEKGTFDTAAVQQEKQPKTYAFGTQKSGAVKTSARIRSNLWVNNSPDRHKAAQWAIVPEGGRL